jgi:hypothetical protein
VRILPNLVHLVLISSTQLWAVMLRNSSELFVYQCMKSKFMDTLEDVITSQRTSPIVRERLLDVLAAAAYASAPSSKNESRFRVLWRKVKPPGKPDEVSLYLRGNPLLSRVTLLTGCSFRLRQRHIQPSFTTVELHTQS